jgi:predicted enzyme related to lactoylglutathione lyase
MEEARLALDLAWVVVDCKDPEVLARFWAEVLHAEIIDSSPEEVAMRQRNGTPPNVLFGAAPDEKVVKNRLHFDLRPDDQDAEVARVLDLGATRVDIGQGDVTWEVLADPEGNEFCILRALNPGEEGP